MTWLSTSSWAAVKTDWILRPSTTIAQEIVGVVRVEIMRYILDKDANYIRYRGIFYSIIVIQLGFRADFKIAPRVRIPGGQSIISSSETGGIKKNLDIHEG